MKYKGKKLQGLREKRIYIPCGDEVIEFIFKVLGPEDDFEKIHPRPIPPTLTSVKGEVTQDINDADFKRALNIWMKNLLNLRFITSISATPGLEFETVNMAEPSTWDNWTNELETTFGHGLANRIYEAYQSAHTITDASLEEAKERFLALKGVKLED